MKLSNNNRTWLIFTFTVLKNNLYEFFSGKQIQMSTYFIKFLLKSYENNNVKK